MNRWVRHVANIIAYVMVLAYIAGLFYVMNFRFELVLLGFISWMIIVCVAEKPQEER